MNFITIGDRRFVEALSFDRMASMEYGTESLTHLDATRLDTWGGALGAATCMTSGPSRQHGSLPLNAPTAFQVAEVL
jgi:hypothetical protein